MRSCFNCRHYIEHATPEQQVKTYIWGCKVLGQQGVVPDSTFCKRFSRTWNLLKLLTSSINVRMTG